ncbi:MAG: type III-B CRISPR module-associated protein Cmr5 [Methanothrix sp.]|nr:type III-B CRISPR module-associated protein Cmr5 [Methanothrix sp.]MCX8207741.1 type III-B CRISPR module-associated protein Cmr5 [Methanothrix sp.]
MRSLEQERAAHALKAVNSIRNESYASKFRSYVERLPAAIVMNGLGQAMAGELAAGGRAEKNEDALAHKKLYDLVAEWIRMRGIYSSDEGLIDAIVKGEQDQYVLAQAEALAYLEWLKKFSQAFLEKEV